MRLPFRTPGGSDAAADSDATDAENRSRLHGFLRAYFRNRPERYEGLQRYLNQSRAGVRFGKYLADALTTAVSVGLLVGAVVFAGVLLWFPLDSIAGNALASVGIGAAVWVTVVAIGWGLALYLPRSNAETRARRIDLLLPQAISYLYALSAGGNDITRVLRAMADEEETYGEVAQEFDHAVRDMDYFGNDPLTALGNLRDLTPSENLRTFLDDLVSTLESGGDINEFLRTESDKYFDRAQDRQRSFLEQLATLAEVYIGAAVVGPLFLIIVLLLISLVGGETLFAIYATVYVIVPVLLGGVLFLVYQISSGYGDIKVKPSLRAIESPPEAAIDDDRLERYQSRRRLVALYSLASRPGAYIQQRPLRVLVFSVPLAVLTLAALAWVDAATLSWAAMTTEPVRTTTVLVLLPALVAIAPLSLLHERRKRRQNRIIDRFPDFLSQLSTANEMGLNVVEALDLVARRSQGDLAEEVRKAANDSYWTGDFGEALERLAKRLGSAQAARTLTLIGTASRVSGDIHRVLNVAARDAANAARLRRNRLQEMQSYTVVVVISFGVYLVIVLLLDVTFLATFGELAEQLPADTESPVQFGDVDPELYRMLLLHSALLQAAGNGLIAGKMGEDSILSGLKYSIGLAVLTLGAYIAVVGI